MPAPSHSTAPIPPTPALPTPPRIPTATYRLQFNASQRFPDALAIVDYLHRLGVSDLYASPLTAARPGSTHGYDVTDPTRLNPELGTDADFSALADALAARGMGLLLDIVPNHMAAHHDNPWWWDVLENGPASWYAEFFDIRWDDDPDGRLVLPVLGSDLDEVLRAHQITLALDPSRGIVLRYFDRLFPIEPAHWAAVLLPRAADIAAALGESSPASAALTRLLARAGPLPPRTEDDPAKLAERRAGIDAIKAHLAAALRADPGVGIILANALAAASRPEEPNVLSPIGAILDRQAYRLEYWKSGLGRINYRRFFDIADLASLRADRPRVFEETHTLARALIGRGSVTGLRIDHVDGLADPLAYLGRLRELAGPETYLVVEKILARGETLPPDWPVAGTTGYDFLNALTHVHIDPGGLEAIEAHARRALRLPPTFDDTAYEAKRFVIDALFNSELRSLARHLARIAAARGSAIAEDELAQGLTTVMACMHVYRTYIDPSGRISADDRRRIEASLQEAQRRDGAHSATYALVGSVLLAGTDGGDSAPPSADERSFIQRWQQLTGPIMAKGVEDTSLYRHITLASLNEVGGEPVALPDPVAAFHAFNAAAAAARPHSLNATSTHDTKRSEDARARLNVLSEIPGRWTALLDRWRTLNEPCRTLIDGRPAPSPAAECLIYQSLVAVWPLDSAAGGDITARVQAAMIKSARESKLETSWSEPSEAYENAVTEFIARILGGRPGSEFLADLLSLVRDIAPAAALNSISHVLLKLTAPGVPDLYQGTELWDHSLVDPDNRRPVDFNSRRVLLEQIESRHASDHDDLLADLLRTWPDGRIKLYTTWRTLHARRDNHNLFTRGGYLPLHADGPRAAHLCAFARRDGDTWAITVTPRLTHALPHPQGIDFPLGPAAWSGTTLTLPPGAPPRWRSALTGEAVTATAGALDASEVLATFPLALLLSPAPTRPSEPRP